MKLGSYPTPAQSALYIGEWHIDDTYSVSYQLQKSNEPLYSYFERQWVNVAPGKEVVTGSLAINFRFPGYLAFAIDEARRKSNLAKTSDLEATRQSNFLASYLEQMRSGNAEERMKLLRNAAAIGPEALRKVSALAYYASNLKGGIPTFYGETSNGRATARPDVFELQDIPGRAIVPIDLWLHYGDMDEVHAVRIIRDVVFTGKGEELQSGASPVGGLSASGINILEVYGFFARTVESLILDPSAIELAQPSD